MEQHTEAVAEIADKVRHLYEHKTPFRIYHGSTNSTRQSQFHRDEMIDTSHLRHVISIDLEGKFALVEPNVAMDALVEETQKHGLIPPVVMEFPGITVGGGFSGTAGESSSFKFGFFDRTVDWIEIVLANGDVVVASHTEDPDLLYGAACAFGTLGVITLLRVLLVAASSFVELAYHPFSNLDQAMDEIKRATNDITVDYVDGMLFSRSNGMICVGRRTDISDGTKIQRFTRARDPWFYLHAQKKFKRPSNDVIPLYDYLFRYDRGAFWTGMYAFKYFMVPFNRITRFLLDPLLHTRVMYHALHKSGHSKIYVIQDIAMPYEAIPEFIDYVDQEFGFYPLWLCPLRQRGLHENSPYGLLAEKPHGPAPETMLNVGIWGPGPSDHRLFIEANLRLEQKVMELKGEKWLYAHTYYTEHEFWSMHNRKEYEELRTKFHAAHLPSIYDKVKVGIPSEVEKPSTWILWLLTLFWSIWPFSGIYGVLEAALGGDYLLSPKQVKRGKQKHE